MAEFSGPFASSQITTEAQWSRMARRWGIDGVIADDPSGTDLKVTAGGTSAVTVAAGEAFVNGFYYSNSSSLNLAVPTNSAGSTTRIDLVVLRCDQAGDSVTARYKAGGTSAPSLATDETGVYEIPLAQCTVAAGSSVVTAASVTDRRWFVGRPVALGSGSAARRNPTRGQLLVEGSDVLLGNGTSWDWLGTAGSKDPVRYTPVWTAGATTINWGIGATNIGRYWLEGKRCTVSIHLQANANPPLYTSPIAVTLPFPAQSTCRELFMWFFTSAYGEGTAVGVGMMNPVDGVAKISTMKYPVSNGNTSTADPDAFSLFTNYPFDIRGGDVLTITGTYEIA